MKLLADGSWGSLKPKSEGAKVYAAFSRMVTEAEVGGVEGVRCVLLGGNRFVLARGSLVNPGDVHHHLCRIVVGVGAAVGRAAVILHLEQEPDERGATEVGRGREDQVTGVE